MSWTVLLLLALGCALQRWFGMFVLGARSPSHPDAIRVADLLPAAVVAALVVQLTFAQHSTVVLDARAAGLLAAAVAVWRRAPFLVVVGIAAGLTAALRALG